MTININEPLEESFPILVDKRLETIGGEGVLEVNHRQEHVVNIGDRFLRQLQATLDKLH